MLINIIGFVLGAGLLAWCIKTAVAGGDWSRIANADPWLVAGLAAASLLSQAASITIFWLTIRPVRRLGIGSLTAVNLFASMLNYAPVRIGLVARVAWHLKVDRLGILVIGAWFLAMGFTLAGAVASAGAASWLDPSFGVRWWAVLGASLIVVGMLIRAATQWPVLRRMGTGLDVMVGDPLALWGAMVLRLVDLIAYAVRMWLAIRILGLSFTPDQVMLLAIVALVIGMNPLGRVGFREVAVAWLASQLAAGDTAAVESTFAQLALVESAGEVIVVLPLGVLASLWMWRRWRAISVTTDEPSVPAPG